MTHQSDNTVESFEAHARESRTGFAAELWDFIKHNKKYWMLPILVVILMVGLMVILGGTAAAPWIYTFH